MSETNLEYKKAMSRLEEILQKIDQSEMGIDELSVSPPFTLELRQKIRAID